MPSKLPLTGIRVIDFGRFIAGPYCAMLLADMGADVIRVDRRQGSEDRYIAAITESGEGGGDHSPSGAKRGCGGGEPAQQCSEEHAAGLRFAACHQAGHYSCPHFNFWS